MSPNNKPLKVILVDETYPLTFKLPPTPTPPETFNAPVFVLFDCVPLVILIAYEVELPLPVTDCKLLLFQI